MSEFNLLEQALIIDREAAYMEASEENALADELADSSINEDGCYTEDFIGFTL